MSLFKRHYLILGMVSAYLIFLITAVSYHLKLTWITQLDNWGYQSLQVLPHWEFDSFAKWLSFLGYSPLTGIITLAVALFLLLRRRRYLFIFFITCILLGNLVNYAVKLMIQRPRPNLPQILPASGFSFPSGHSANSMLLYGSLIVLLWLLSSHKILNWLMTVIFLGLIFLVGCSRIYLQVHYTSDVLAGWTFAAGNICLFILWYHRSLLDESGGRKKHLH